MDWLNYHHLLYFWTVAKEGSITKACEKLHLSQPTISNQLKTLEQSIGQPLFQRAGRQLVLTEMGQLVYRYADQIFTIGRDLQQFLAGQREASRRQRLAIGISDSLPKMVTYRILEPLLARQQELYFICYEDDNLEGLLLRLSQFELDLVLADAPVSPGAMIKGYNHLLGESGISFFAAPELAARYGEGFPASLAEAPMFLPSVNTALRRNLDAWFAAHECLPVIVGEFDDLALQNVFGQHGHGVFCLPTAIEEDICQSLQVKVIGRIPEVRSSYYAISVERTLRHPVIMELVESARTHLFGGVGKI
ncbi:MAG: transcriptional activator NhaR [Candidatus Melainabacteria bacterium HGW-Melainabacteria-1]|nr:MAG: transcriptional activator NhaR [Candidatus Melainabacteria bacterium HGW-Melainabacteria-1]